MIVYRISDELPLRRIHSRTHVCAAVQRSALLLVIFIVAAGTIVLGQVSEQNPQSNEQQRRVRGTVVNSVTHAPVGRALVSTSDSRLATLTDSEGHFEFVLPTPSAESTTFFMQGQQTLPSSYAFEFSGLSARKPGFLKDPNDSPRVGEFPVGDMTITLMPEALIKGRVALSEADAAVGIDVQVFMMQVQEGLPRWMPGASVRTNSAGEFRFAELAPGAYRLVTHELMDNDPVAVVPGGQLYGYAPVYYPGVSDFASAATIQLTAGQIFQADLSVTRQPYYSVKMAVASGEAINGMNINVSVQGRRGPGYSLGYNNETKQIEGMLPNGNYLVEAATDGPTLARGAAGLAVSGAPSEGSSLTLHRSGSIPLDVKEEFSNDAARNDRISYSDGHRTFNVHGPQQYLQARVEAADDFEQQVNGQIRPPTGPNDDSMILENLPPGRYWLRLNSSRGYVASATLGGVDLLHEPLVVGAGSGLPIEVKLRDDFAEMEGSVAEMSTGSTTNGTVASRPYSSGVWVYCFPLPDSGGQFQQLEVSTDGKFSLKMVPGSYRILAFNARQLNLPYRDATAMRPYETKGEVVHLIAGQKATLQVHLTSSSE